MTVSDLDKSEPPQPPQIDVAVVGGGPAGLRAAEVAASLGAQVALFEANPFVGRKFLLAGRGGLNLTHAEDPSTFPERYQSNSDSHAADFWRNLLQEFSPDMLRKWAASLGIETFQASTGRIYPKEMKAAPLLRNWMRRMKSAGITFHHRHTLTAVHAGNPLNLEFAAPETSSKTVSAKSVVLALGGASWPRTGSDGRWVPLLSKLGLKITPLQPANCGWECEWPGEVQKLLQGKPLKNIRVESDGFSMRGELLVTEYGLEGGAIYGLTHVLRKQCPPHLWIDFKPDSSPESLLRRLGSAEKNFLAEACARWKLDQTVQALLRAFLKEDATALQTVESVKRFPLILKGPRPIEEAISTAGGINWDCLDPKLMARDIPGLFFAGEMLDWEAPTGGYLLQGCFATGTRAGVEAARRIRTINSLEK